MAIDDAAGRKAVRERRAPAAGGESVFTLRPRTSLRHDVPDGGVLLREDVHLRAIEAARRALKSRQAPGSE